MASEIECKSRQRHLAEAGRALREHSRPVARFSAPRLGTTKRKWIWILFPGFPSKARHIFCRPNALARPKCQTELSKGLACLHTLCLAVICWLEIRVRLDPLSDRDGVPVSLCFFDQVVKGPASLELGRLWGCAFNQVVEGASHKSGLSRHLHHPPLDLGQRNTLRVPSIISASTSTFPEKSSSR